MDNFFELEQTQFLQSLALAVLKIPYAGYLLSDKRSNFIDYVSCTKNLTLIYVFENKRCYKGMPIFYKKKYILSIQFLEEHIFWIKTSHLDLKITTTLYS